MNCTSAPLCTKSENIILGIQGMLKQLRSVNAEITTQQSANTEAIKQENASHEQTITHLQLDNDELEVQLQRNEAFIQGVEKLLDARTEPTA